MNKKIGLIIAFSLILLLSNPIQSVEDVVKPPEKPLFNQFIDSIQRIPFTSVGGRLCSTYHDDTKNWFTSRNYECPSRLSGGCAVAEFAYAGTHYKDYEKRTVNREYMDEHLMSPGESNRFWGDTFLMVYYCTDDCQCADDTFESQGCGAGPCDSDQMYRTRDCSCADREEVCADGYEECSGCQDEGVCVGYGRGSTCAFTEDTAYQCYDTDDDGCLEYSEETCGSNEVCEDGECVQEGPTCQDEAPCDTYGSGASCGSSGDAVVWCRDTDNDPCLEAYREQCGSNEVCEDGECVLGDDGGDDTRNIQVSIIDPIIDIITVR